MLQNPFIPLNSPFVIAHQGGERLFPSNTLYAFEQAYKLGVDMFELDVHQTSDGHLVVIHDDTVDRTTEGKGKIKEMTLQEIQALDAGYYWTEDGTNYPYRAQGIQIPTLVELFERYPDVPMIIDIKDETSSDSQVICSLLNKYNKTDHTIIGSFHIPVIKKFRNLCPDVPTSLHFVEALRMVLHSYTFVLASLFSPKARAAHVPMRKGMVPIIHPGFIKLAKQKNIAVHVWTVNDPKEMQYLIDLGVDGIMTDRPDLLLNLLNR